MIKKIVLIVTLMFIVIIDVRAEEFTGYITGENVGFRACPEANNTKCPRLYDLFLTRGHTVTMESKDLIPGAGCNLGWYKAKYDSKEGYVCSEFVEFKTTVTPKNPEEYANYAEYLKALGFPDSYIPALSVLNDQYPKWEFMPVITNIDFNTAVNAQSIGGKSCTYSKSQGYYLTDGGSYDYLTDTFKSVDVGCYATNQTTTAYYLDPRNWLNERMIMMFEDLSFNPENQTVGAVTSVLGNNVNLSKYVNEFYNASTQVINKETKTISPVHLASRSRLEIGNGSSAGRRVNGDYPYLYCGHNLKGLYNFYNIGAYMDSCTPAGTPSARGMAYACGVRCGFYDTYERPWDTPQKGINGGAQFIMDRYFSRGQDTIYFQKFNTSGVTTPFTNQYMQNIAAPSSEGGMTYNAYQANNVLVNKIKFKIPVYTNMPQATSLPDPGNPNNRLNSLKVNDQLLEGFSYDKNEYLINVPNNFITLKVEGTPINNKATVEGVGNIAINPEVKTIIVKVTAENKSIYEYKININYVDPNAILMKPAEMIVNSSLKSDGIYILDLLEGQIGEDIINNLNKVNPNSLVNIKNVNGEIKTGSLATGDKLSITSNNETKEYEIVILGDGSGDGLVSIVDLLRVQKHILKVSNISGAQLKAIDLDKDDKITIVDLLRMQKHILGITKIDNYI